LKKLYSAIFLLLVGLTASAQSFSWQDGTFEVSGPYDGPNVHGEVTVRNISSQPLDLICRISSDTMTAGHTKWFCFGPTCYPPTVTVSIVTTVNAGDTALLIAYCAPNGAEGASTVNYEIYDANGNSDTISFSFHYTFNLSGTNEISSAKYALSAASPNPAFSVASISYYIAKAKDASIVFKNLAGIEVKEIKLSENQNTLMLPVADFPSGVYIYTLIMNGRPTVSNKFLVIHY